MNQSTHPEQLLSCQEAITNLQLEKHCLWQKQTWGNDILTSMQVNNMPFHFSM